MKEIEKLRARREAILEELAGIERMRRGCVMEQYVETVRADGSKGARGPYFLYTFKEKKKTISRRITRRDLVPVYRSQIDSFRRFQKLVSELTAVGEKLGDISMSEKADVKKNEEFQIEKEAEVEAFLRMARAQAGAPDLEAWEKCLREAVLSAGARVLERLLADVCCGRRDEAVVCDCGARMQSRGVREKELRAILGPLTLRRTMFQCPDCGETRFPSDEALNVANTSFSPGLRRMMSRAGGNSTFKEAAEDLKIYAGVAVGAKDVERTAEAAGAAMELWARTERDALLADDEWKPPEKSIPVLYVCMDGTGVPVTKKESAGRRGKQPDGSAKTREAKLGCVFTQTTTDEEGFAVRDPGSTTFTGAIENCDEFGVRIYAEALRRGLERAEKVVVLGDGAEWIRNLVELHFNCATQIVDLYHARERVCKIIAMLFKENEKFKKLYRLKWWTYLDEGEVEKFIADARATIPFECEIAEDIEKELGYFENNLKRMRYNQFREQGLFVGSGVIEAGCKTIIAARMKQSGMEWSVRGANAVISLRCMYHSNRVEDFWEAASG